MQWTHTPYTHAFEECFQPCKNTANQAGKTSFPVTRRVNLLKPKISKISLISKKKHLMAQKESHNPSTVRTHRVYGDSQRKSPHPKFGSKRFRCFISQMAPVSPGKKKPWPQSMRLLQPPKTTEHTRCAGWKCVAM